jgi:ribosomal protein S1
MSENEAKETMQDFEAELEASFRKINEGDILTGTVISVDEDAITLESIMPRESSKQMKSATTHPLSLTSTFIREMS